MKHFLVAICMIIFLCAGNACAAMDPTVLEAKIIQLREKIDSQIEKIKTTRDSSDSESNAVQSRVVEQLNRCQDNLTRQIEIVERMREQLKDKLSDGNVGIDQLESNVKSSIDQTSMSIDAQIRETNALLIQLETMKNNIGSVKSNGRPNAEPHATADNSSVQVENAAAPTTNTWNTTASTGNGSTLPPGTKPNG